VWKSKATWSMVVTMTSGKRETDPNWQKEERQEEQEGDPMRRVSSEEVTYPVQDLIPMMQQPTGEMIYDIVVARVETRSSRRHFHKTAEVKKTELIQVIADRTNEGLNPSWTSPTEPSTVAEDQKKKTALFVESEVGGKEKLCTTKGAPEARRDRVIENMFITVQIVKSRIPWTILFRSLQVSVLS